MMTFDPSSEYTAQRIALFDVVCAYHPARSALYPGCYVDLSPSVFIPRVTYLDVDRRAASFFTQRSPSFDELARLRRYAAVPDIRFLHRDYTALQPHAVEPVDLLVSLYAGPVSSSTLQFLRPGGLLLAGDSHGDATLARHNRALTLEAAVEVEIGVEGERTDETDGKTRRHGPRVVTEGLEEYFRFKRDRPVDLDQVRREQKGPRYARLAECYLFRYEGPNVAPPSRW